jgi:polyhydroxyalkanoate synthesis repressor PhaR
MIVKKYGNRRLYDTESSRYVRLDEIAERIRAGADVRVVDATSGADLTAPTLAQMIFENERTARLLPVPLLLQLIRMGEEPLADFLGRYVSWALEIYMQARSGLGGLGSLFNPFSTLRSFPTPAPLERTRPAEPKSETGGDEIAELRREVAALKKSIKSARPRKPKA